jgi:hypothetical protein
MFGGYDPAYNPENLEKMKQKAEQGELSPEQAAVANKWSEVMENAGEAPAETPAEAAAEGGGDETEPTIAETEPQLQQQLAEHMDADGIPTDDETDQVEEEATNPEEETSEEAEVAEAATKATEGGKHHSAKGGEPLMGAPLKDKMDPDKDLQNMAIMTPAGEMLAKSVEIATEAVEEGIPELIDKVADKIPDGEDGGSEGTLEAEEAEVAAEEAAEEAAEAKAEVEAKEETSAIQHFSAEQKEPSNFNPLPPEEQRDQKKDAEAAHAQTYSEPGEADAFKANDNDNLVAQAIGNELADGGVDLNGIGSTLKGDGVDISDEVSQLDADIAKDLSSVGTTGDIENRAQDSATANNLAVESAASALAAKEEAGDAVAAAKSGGKSAMEKIEEANRLAEQAQSLATASESAASAIGQSGAGDMLDDARMMAEETKEMAAKAQETAEANADKEGDEEEAGGDNVFSADDYPEMNDIDSDGDGKPKAVTSTAE